MSNSSLKGARGGEEGEGRPGKWVGRILRQNQQSEQKVRDRNACSTPESAEWPFIDYSGKKWPEIKMGKEGEAKLEEFTR